MEGITLGNSPQMLELSSSIANLVGDIFPAQRLMPLEQMVWKDDGNSKYRLTDKVKVNREGIILTRIQAVRDFGDIKNGTLGGWIESYGNLSQSGNCWIDENSEVFGCGCVIEDAVLSNSRIHGMALVRGNARIYNADISMTVTISGNAEVY